MSSDLEFSTEILIEAEPDLVYEFFTDAKLLERWHGVHAETDPRPGGKFLLNVTGSHITQGEFLVTEPGVRLVFTWGFAEAGLTVVEVSFTKADSGTLVRIRQHGFQNATECVEHKKGWTDYLLRLAQVVRQENPGADPRRTLEGDRIARAKNEPVQ